MKLLTQKQVAELFQVSQATVSRMAGAGELPCVILKQGRRKKLMRFRESDLEQWIARRTHAGPVSERPKRKRGENGDGTVTEKPLNFLVSQPVELQRENTQCGEGHRFEQPVSGV